MFRTQNALKDLKRKEVLHLDVAVGRIKKLFVAKVIFKEVVPTIIDGEDMRRFLKDMTDILVGKVPELKSESDRFLDILQDIRRRKQQQSADRNELQKLKQRMEIQETRVYDLLLMFAMRLNMGSYLRDDDAVKPVIEKNEVDSKRVYQRSYRTRRRVDTLDDRYRRPGPQDFR